MSDCASQLSVGAAGDGRAVCGVRLAMRRRSLTFFVVCIFLSWNVVTYLFFTSRQPTKQSLPSLDGDTPAQLLLLQKGIVQQQEKNERLLAELQQLLQRQQLPRSLKGNGGHAVEETGVVVPAPPPAADTPIPILVMACNRPAIRRCLDELLKYRPSKEKFPIVVSQDCGHAPTATVIQSYGEQLKHIQHPDLSTIVLKKADKKFQGYYKISRHYKWALEQMFIVFGYSVVVIVEDDLNISSDFFEYFGATFPILVSDPTLWCVSAWNDNGKTQMVSGEPERLYRTDFFPGLGWMLTKETYLGLRSDWPATFWDDWMRHPHQRKDRACLRPEISRTNTFGKIGVSKGQFYERHLKYIKLNEKFVPFTKMDLSYLKKAAYDEVYMREVYGCPSVSLSALVSGAYPAAPAVRLEYTSKVQFKAMSKALGLMDDLKSGVPRTGYRGVVSFMRNGQRVYFGPPSSWSGYDTSWN